MGSTTESKAPKQAKADCFERTNKVIVRGKYKCLKTVSKTVTQTALITPWGYETSVVKKERKKKTTEQI